MLAACGNGSSDEPPPDAAPQPPGCSVSADYGDVGVVPPELSIAVRLDDNLGDAKSITYIAALNLEQDQVIIQLYRGFGIFQGKPIAAGTYELTGEELNYATCGACVRIFGNRPAGSGRPAQDLMATHGTLVVSEIGPAGSGTFRAELQDADFEHVHIDDTSFESTPVNDGCGTSVSHLGADVPMSGAL
jgi:hypothetical protein